MLILNWTPRETFESVGGGADWLWGTLLDISSGPSKTTMRIIHLKLLFSYKDSREASEDMEPGIGMEMLNIDSSFQSWQRLAELLPDVKDFPNLERAILDLVSSDELKRRTRCLFHRPCDKTFLVRRGGN
jgi:hypothetical protein